MPKFLIVIISFCTTSLSMSQIAPDQESTVYRLGSDQINIIKDLKKNYRELHPNGEITISVQYHKVHIEQRKSGDYTTIFYVFQIQFEGYKLHCFDENVVEKDDCDDSDKPETHWAFEHTLYMPYYLEQKEPWIQA